MYGVVGAVLLLANFRRRARVFFGVGECASCECDIVLDHFQGRLQAVDVRCVAERRRKYFQQLVAGSGYRYAIHTEQPLFALRHNRISAFVDSERVLGRVDRQFAALVFPHQSLVLPVCRLDVSRASVVNRNAKRRGLVYGVSDGNAEVCEKRVVNAVHFDDRFDVLPLVNLCQRTGVSERVCALGFVASVRYDILAHSVPFVFFNAAIPIVALLFLVEEKARLYFLCRRVCCGVKSARIENADGDFVVSVDVRFETDTTERAGVFGVNGKSGFDGLQHLVDVLPAFEFLSCLRVLSCALLRLMGLCDTVRRVRLLGRLYSNDRLIRDLCGDLAGDFAREVEPVVVLGRAPRYFSAIHTLPRLNRLHHIVGYDGVPADLFCSATDKR